jgi:hypothetical protein
MHLLAEAALRANAEAIADQQNTDYQLRVDRRTPDLALEGQQVIADAGQVDEAVDRKQQVIGRHVSFKLKLVEQSILPDPAFPIITFTSGPNDQTLAGAEDRGSGLTSRRGYAAGRDRADVCA